MSPETFDLLAARTRLGARSIIAARMVLVGGVKLLDAGIAAGWPESSASQNAWRAVNRIRALAEADNCCPTCGREYAMAAMHCGKTAAEAVEIAAVYDLYTGGGVDVVTHD